MMIIPVDCWEKVDWSRREVLQYLILNEICGRGLEESRGLSSKSSPSRILKLVLDADKGQSCLAKWLSFIEVSRWPSLSILNMIELQAWMVENSRRASPAFPWMIVYQNYDSLLQCMFPPTRPAGRLCLRLTCHSMKGFHYVGEIFMFNQCHLAKFIPRTNITSTTEMATASAANSNADG